MAGHRGVVSSSEGEGSARYPSRWAASGNSRDDPEQSKRRPKLTSGASAPDVRIWSALPYGFGETRVATLALLTFMVLSGWRSGGVVMAKFTGHAVTFRSSPTVFAETPMSGSTSTCIRSGQPPRSVWSAATLFTLYRMRAPPCRVRVAAGSRLQPFAAGDRPKTDPASLDITL